MDRSRVGLEEQREERRRSFLPRDSTHEIDRSIDRSIEIDRSIASKSSASSWPASSSRLLP